MDHQPKFFENLSGTGKAIGVLTSGGDAQGGYGGRGKRGRVEGRLRRGRERAAERVGEALGGWCEGGRSAGSPCGRHAGGMRQCGEQGPGPGKGAVNMAGVWAGGRRELHRTELAHPPGAGVLSNTVLCGAAAGELLLLCGALSRALLLSGLISARGIPFCQRSSFLSQPVPRASVTARFF